MNELMQIFLWERNDQQSNPIDNKDPWPNDTNYLCSVDHNDQQRVLERKLLLLEWFLSSKTKKNKNWN